jgi:A/G-specific adenine glycosylase
VIDFLTDPDSVLTGSEWNRLRTWFKTHGRHQLPWRKMKTPWEILVAETLLHRTRAEAVDQLFSEIISEFPDPGAVIKKIKGWKNLTQTIGLFWRAEKFIKTCEVLVNQFNGIIPEKVEALLALPGVGHYTASAVRCFAFSYREVLVDTNTIRLASRIFGEGIDPSQHRVKKAYYLVKRLGEDGLPPDAQDNFALLDLASMICRPKNPQCTMCPLREQSFFCQKYIRTLG